MAKQAPCAALGAGATEGPPGAATEEGGAASRAPVRPQRQPPQPRGWPLQTQGASATRVLNPFTGGMIRFMAPVPKEVCQTTDVIGAVGDFPLKGTASTTAQLLSYSSTRSCVLHISIQTRMGSDDASMAAMQNSARGHAGVS